MARLVGALVMTTVEYAATETPPRRACGAMALRSVLQRFGVRRSLQEIWNQVAQPDPFGGLAARSYRLAACAMACGLEAVTVQCRSERWREGLQVVTDPNLAVVLNHRAAFAPDEGHFSELTGVSEASVVLNDPFMGPGQRLSLEQLQALWQGNRETTGFVLVAIGPRAAGIHAARRFEKPSCPGCGIRLALSPSQIFVERDWRADGLWQRFYCHGCDAAFSPQV